MTMLKTFDLKGNKQSFASWISNLSPCETPFTSMVNKQSVDQVQYSWQTDRLAAAGKDYAGTALGLVKEGSKVDFSTAIGVGESSAKPTEVHHNFTQILRKVVRVSDTTKKIALYGRASELSLQMEKAGMEIKRDLEFMMLNQDDVGQIGTSAQAGRFAGFFPLVAAKDAVDGDTGAIVHKVVTYADANAVKFTKAQVFDLTLQLYIAGSKANKIMLHPMHMHVFSDWISNANTGGAVASPHVHRMFDGLDNKFNVHVAKVRDPLGQEFTLIPNRFMPKNRLFFFNESDWTQMILRAPEKVELAKNGSSEKFMIEMEVGLRHKNPFASGILEFNMNAKSHIQKIEVIPQNQKVVAGAEVESDVEVYVFDSAAAAGTTGTVKVEVTTINDDGTTGDNATINPAEGTGASVAAGKASFKVKHKKGAKVRATAALETTAGTVDDIMEGAVEFFDTRD
ncbi:MAG: SU10 major capsid protein [Bacteroidales bacterium]